LDFRLLMSSKKDVASTTSLSYGRNVLVSEIERVDNIQIQLKNFLYEETSICEATYELPLTC